LEGESNSARHSGGLVVFAAEFADGIGVNEHSLGELDREAGT
jgi:hypothetical protein